MKLKIIALDERLGICQLSPDQKIPDWALATSGLLSISKTPDEISIVCFEDHIPKNIRSDKGWRGFKLAGSFDFSMTGILKQILDPLAEAKIGIFAISTFNTDYVLVKEENFNRATNVLSRSFEVQ